MAPPPSPYDDPVPRGWKLVQGTLRVTVALQCFGAAAAALHQGQEPAVVRTLSDWNVISDGVATQAARYSGWGLLACGALTLLRPCWPVLFPVAAWFGVLAAAPAVATQESATAASLMAGVTTPLVLLLVDFWPPALAFSIGRGQVAMLLLRTGVIIAFIAHAVLLLRECGDPGEWDAATRRAYETLTGLDATGARVVQLLAAAAAIDLALALNLLAARVRPLALALAVWGAAIAALPVVAGGPLEYPAALQSAALGGAPLALFFWWLCALREQSPIIIPGRG
jgi:hypothetical protein